MNGKPSLLRINQQGTPASPVLWTELLCDRPSGQIEKEASVLLERLLRTRIDLTAFYEMSTADDHLRPLVERFLGFKPPEFSFFETIANGIIFQRISLYAGMSIMNRFADTYGARFSTSGMVLRAFPEPQSIARQRIEDLKQAGLTLNKTKALFGAAKAITDGVLSLS